MNTSDPMGLCPKVVKDKNNVRFSFRLTRTPQVSPRMLTTIYDGIMGHWNRQIGKYNVTVDFSSGVAPRLYVTSGGYTNGDLQGGGQTFTGEQGPYSVISIPNSPNAEGMKLLAGHEMGHALGLPDNSADPDALMHSDPVGKYLTPTDVDAAVRACGPADQPSKKRKTGDVKDGAESQ